MSALLVLFVVGICSAVPLEQGNENYPVLDHPEEVPGLFEGDIDLEPGENPTDRDISPRESEIFCQCEEALPSHLAKEVCPEARAVQNIFHDAMAEIESKTKIHGRTCVHFKPHHGESAYMYFGPGTGCHTPVGYSHQKVQVTIGHGCERKGTVMHEILHGLGFYHEQSRHDRDHYVTIHLSNVQHGHYGNFNKYAVPYIDELGQPYDYGSIMHYPMYAFAIDRNKPTIEPKQRDVTIGQRVRLSPIDIKEIQLLYGCH